MNGRTNPVCLIHNCQKRKNGKSKTGKQLWRCGLCHAGRPATTRKGSHSRRTKGYKHVPANKRPHCVQCHGGMHSHGWYKGVVRRWFCKRCGVEVLAGTPPKAEPKDRGEELVAYVRERVSRMNGHDPQMRDDIVQEIVTDIIGGKLKKEEVTKPKIKQYISYRSRLQANKYHEVSIDQPIGDDGDGLTLKDVLEG